MTDGTADATISQASHSKTDGQSFRTSGIAPMDRPGAVTRFFMGIVAWAEKLNFKYAKLGNPPVYDNATFPWAAEVEKEWPAIRKELDTILLRQSELPSF